MELVGTGIVSSSMTETVDIGSSGLSSVISLVGIGDMGGDDLESRTI